ncbi:hypothetical protein QVD17_09123 [Tagetes erecta]|uniref:Uncharacterized protein n=1 Tax=Tagetes erecta TaxID=13708 RepID=A0AAD8P4S4_TARER|nr:hypothetical protein QVD17_09123 [Tagetes erecta]
MRRCNLLPGLLVQTKAQGGCCVIGNFEQRLRDVRVCRFREQEGLKQWLEKNDEACVAVEITRHKRRLGFIPRMIYNVMFLHTHTHTQTTVDRYWCWTEK